MTTTNDKNKKSKENNNTQLSDLSDNENKKFKGKDKSNKDQDAKNKENKRSDSQSSHGSTGDIKDGYTKRDGGYDHRHDNQGNQGKVDNKSSNQYKQKSYEEKNEKSNNKGSSQYKQKSYEDNDNKSNPNRDRSESSHGKGGRPQDGYTRQDGGYDHRHDNKGAPRLSEKSSYNDKRTDNNSKNYNNNQSKRDRSESSHGKEGRPQDGYTREDGGYDHRHDNGKNFDQKEHPRDSQGRFVEKDGNDNSYNYKKREGSKYRSNTRRDRSDSSHGKGGRPQDGYTRKDGGYDHRHDNHNQDRERDEEGRLLSKNDEDKRYSKSQKNKSSSYKNDDRRRDRSGSSHSRGGRPQDGYTRKDGGYDHRHDNGKDNDDNYRKTSRSQYNRSSNRNDDRRRDRSGSSHGRVGKPEDGYTRQDGGYDHRHNNDGRPREYGSSSKNYTKNKSGYKSNTKSYRRDRSDSSHGRGGKPQDGYTRVDGGYDHRHENQGRPREKEPGSQRKSVTNYTNAKYKDINEFHPRDGYRRSRSKYDDVDPEELENADFEEMLYQINLKRPKTGYNIFIQEKMDEDKTGDLIETVQKYGDVYKNMSEEEKAPYEEKHKEDLERFKLHLNLVREHLITESDEYFPGAKLRRPLGAYKLFLVEMAENGKFKEGQNPIVEGAKMWPETSEEEKEKFYRQAHKEKLVYDYNKREQTADHRAQVGKARTAFNLFCHDQRNKVHGNLKQGEIFEIFKEQFDNLSSEERKKYDRMAEQEKEETQRRRDDFKETTIAANEKRTPGPYGLYIKEKASERKRQNQDKDMNEIFAELGDEWHTLSEKEKEKYNDMYREKLKDQGLEPGRTFTQKHGDDKSVYSSSRNDRSSSKRKSNYNDNKSGKKYNTQN